MNKPKPTLLEIDAMLEEVRAMRRMLIPSTLAGAVEWEREFGPNRTPAQRQFVCKSLARKFGVSYREVEHVLPWFADDGAVA